jgi:hypothetical protein
MTHRFRTGKLLLFKFGFLLLKSIFLNTLYPRCVKLSILVCDCRSLMRSYKQLGMSGIYQKLLFGLALALRLSAAADLASPQTHWAFQPLKQPPVPQLRTEGGDQNPIDRFIGAKLQQLGLKPNCAANKRTLVRRIYFDLLGLPPAPSQIQEFLADNSPRPVANLIERLLASPQYGERWGRYWLDVARYADTAGDNADYPVPELRLYRDYVIDSFNRDKPFNQFVEEQLAGDILARKTSGKEYAEKVAATGFLALSRRFGTMPTEHWHLVMEDSIDTTGRAFLGLTLRCARCHDHKFDPISKEDYYALYGFFASTVYPYPGSEEYKSKDLARQNFVPLICGDELTSKLKDYECKISKLKEGLHEKEIELPEGKRLEELKNQIDLFSKSTNETEKASLPELRKEKTDLEKKLQEKFKDLRAELRKLEKPGAPPGVPVAYAVKEGKPVDVPVQMRGEPGQPGPVIKRGVPKFLDPNHTFHSPAESSGRLELAQWIASAENPLTPRVIVNRIWQHHFGKGLVRTPSNFGIRGDSPSHPELLDWLASEFITRGWSIKELHRLILTSKTYQQSSEDSEENLAKDPANTWYWRFDRRRLDAEAIRDGILSVSGNLNLGRPEAHPFGALETWGYTQHQPFKAVYPTQHRSVYLMTQRIQRHPFLALFDGPDTNTSTDTRTDSTVPLQALFLMNNPFIQEESRLLAQRILNSRNEIRDQIAFATELVWARPPSDEETSKALAYIEKYKQALAGNSNATDKPAANQDLEAWASYARVLLASNQFFYVD